MINWKRCLAALLAIMLFVISGCAEVEVPPEDTIGKTPPSVPILGNVPTNTEPQTAIQCRYLPEKVDNPENLPVLKWICLDTGDIPISTLSQDAAEAINQALAEKEMPFRLQFVLCSGVYGEEWFRLPETSELLAEADIVYACWPYTLAKQYLMPLTQYVREDASLSLSSAVPHKAYWAVNTADGENYGIPARVTIPATYAWVVDRKAVENLGLTVQDLQAGLFSEQDILFAQLYERNENKPFLNDVNGMYQETVDSETGDIIGTTGGLSYGYTNQLMDYVPGALKCPIRYYYRYQLVGSCFAIDLQSETPRIVNYLETDYVRQSQAAIMRYRDAGYSTTSEIESLIFCATEGAYGNSTYYDENTGWYFVPGAQLQFGTYYEYWEMNGISAASAHQEDALQLLSLMANDKAFRELLLFGVEGQDYITDETGAPQTIIREDGSQYYMGFLSPYSDLYGTRADLRVPTPEGSTRMETHLDALDRANICYSILFDFSAVEPELTAVNAILSRQERKHISDPPVLFSAFGSLTEAEYDQMLAEIQAAGGDKIRAELQKQLDAWLEVNPDWDK